MNLFSKPYHLYALAAVLLIMLSLVPFERSMDLPVTGSSYILSYKFTLRGLGMLLFLLWLLYLFTQKILYSAVLARIHVVSTIVVVGTIVFLFFHFAGTPVPKQSEPVSIQGRVSAQMIAPALIMLLFLIQAMYILNLLLGVIRRINRSA
ncbi:MAG: hypothetical protein M9933_12280 [Chitinophagaceae bacterium]|nr:hypothetical protein [Chitinophagaceae bacterium]